MHFKVAATLALVGYSTVLVGCGGYSQNGLVGDYVSASKCPANGCADQAADPNYISLKAGSTSLVAPANSDRLEISGECFPSTYANNMIYVTVTPSTGGGNIPVGAASADAADGAPVCKNGRFNLVMGTANMAPNSAFNVRLELVGIDKNGTQFKNAAGGAASLIVRK